MARQRHQATEVDITVAVDTAGTGATQTVEHIAIEAESAPQRERVSSAFTVVHGKPRGVQSSRPGARPSMVSKIWARTSATGRQTQCPVLPCSKLRVLATGS